MSNAINRSHVWSIRALTPQLLTVNVLCFNERRQNTSNEPLTFKLISVIRLFERQTVSVAVVVEPRRRPMRTTKYPNRWSLLISICWLLVCAVKVTSFCRLTKVQTWHSLSSVLTQPSTNDVDSQSRSGANHWSRGGRRPVTNHRVLVKTNFGRSRVFGFLAKLTNALLLYLPQMNSNGSQPLPPLNLIAQLSRIEKLRPPLAKVNFRSLQRLKFFGLINHGWTIIACALCGSNWLNSATAVNWLKYCSLMNSKNYRQRIETGVPDP